MTFVSPHASMLSKVMLDHTQAEDLIPAFSKQTDKQNGQREVLSLVKGWGKGGSVGEGILDNNAQLLLRNA